MAHIALSAYKVTSGGILGYITRITTDLPKLFPEHQYTIFLNEKLNYLPQYENSTHVYLEDSNRGRFDRLRWEQLILPRELKSRNVDLLYTFSPSDIYFAKCPTIVRIGNMAPFDTAAIKTEGKFKERFRLYMLALFSRIAAHTADRTLVQSSYAAELLVENNGFKKDKTIGLDRGFEVADILSDTTFPEYDNVKYILCVSHVFRYKMLVELVQEYAVACSKQPSLPKLIIAGEEKDRAYADEVKSEIKAAGLEDKISMIGGVPREDLYNLIRNSEFNIFSSLVETFPTTLLEQMSIGSALLVANCGVMPKFCEDSVVYFQPYEKGSLANGISTLMRDEKLRSSLRVRAKERFTDLEVTWESAFRDRQALFDEVISQSC